MDAAQQTNANALLGMHSYGSFMSAFLHPVSPSTANFNTQLHDKSDNSKRCLQLFIQTDLSIVMLSRKNQNSRLKRSLPTSVWSYLQTLLS